jgi:SAM-dependent methyltransferase
VCRVLGTSDDPDRDERIAALGYDYSGHRLEPVPSCPLCGSTRQTEVSTRDRYGFDTVCCVCPRCGLGYLNPRLGAADYATFYARFYRPLVSAYYGRRIDAETIQDEQRGYAEDLLRFVAAHLDSTPRTLLDIGGSTGVVADVFCRAFGAQATVLDPAPDELRVASDAGIETIEGFVESFDSGGRRWDLVLLCQTIDHLLDAPATLRAIRELLADGGHAFVDIIDVEFTARRRGGIEGAVKVDHTHYFTPATTRAAFALTGLDVVAERLSGGGQWGFLVVRGEPREPDWAVLGEHADRLVELFWRLRAGPTG